MSPYEVQKNTALAGSEEMGRPVSPFDQKIPVVYPKPQRVGCLVNNPNMMSSRRHRRSLQELCDLKAGAEEVMDFILMKEANGALSSPYFCGSPPIRVSNPLVLDSQFRDAKASPKSLLQYSSSSSSTSSPSAHEGGCIRNKFGLKPATIRVEGFDCPTSGITAVA